MPYDKNMVKKRDSLWQRRTVNVFAALAYLILAIQWMFAVVVYLPFIASLLPERTAEPSTTSVPEPIFTAPNEGSVLSFFIIALVMIIMIGLTVYILAKIPSTIARTGRKAVKNSSAAVTHAYAKVTHQKETKRLRLQLEHRVVVAIKIFLLAAPVALAYGVYLLPESELAPEMVIYLSAFLAQIVLLLFAAQYTLAYLFSIKKTDL